MSVINFKAAVSNGLIDPFNILSLESLAIAGSFSTLMLDTVFVLLLSWCVFELLLSATEFDLLGYGNEGMVAWQRWEVDLSAGT